MDVLYDTHAHLDFPDFAGDLEEVLDRARENGIRRILTIGCDLESSRRAVDLAERFDDVFAVVGWHPGYVEAAPADVRPELREWTGHPRVVAIGECGVDLFRAPPEGTAEREALARLQRRVFEQQLEVAADAGLPCVFHQRGAWELMMEIWEPVASRVPGVFHCFVGTPQEAKRVIDLGSYVSFTGIVTFKNADLVRETLSTVPPDRFLLETDCPYLAPAPHRGKRSEPAHVADIARVVAAVRGWDPVRVSKETCDSVHRLFGRLPRP